MKKYFLLFICLLFAVSLALSGCSKNQATDDLYGVTKQSNGTYSYFIKDRNGNTILDGEDFTKPPQITVIDDSILKVSLQTGTGLSTRWTYYCNVSSGEKSGVYFGVLGEYENKVIYPSQYMLDKKSSVVIHDFFDSGLKQKKIELPDISDCADPITNFKINDDGTAVITYLSGTDFEETDMTIDLK